MTNKHTTQLEKEYYLVMPNKAHGKTVKGEKVHYALTSTITRYATESEYIAALEAEGIPLNEEETIEGAVETSTTEESPSLLQKAINLFTSN